MNKGELVEAVVGQTGAARGQVESILNATLDQIMTAVAGGDRVSLVGFGTYERRDRGARTGRNPQTGQAISIKASRVPAFKPGQGFKDMVGGAKGSAKKGPAKKSSAKKAPAKKR